jgi:thioredoxin 1
MARVFDTPIITSDQSIDRVLAADLPIVFVFLDGVATASLEQAMKRLAREHSGNLLVVQVPRQDGAGAARRYEN